MRAPTMVVAMVTAVALVACSTPRVPKVTVGGEVLVPLSEWTDPPPLQISEAEFQRVMRGSIQTILDAPRDRHAEVSPPAGLERVARCLDGECQDEAQLAAVLAQVGTVEREQVDLAFAVLRREALAVRVADWQPTGPMEREYAAWCERRGQPGDCLSLGQVDERGRKRIALSAAFSAVWSGAVHGMNETVNPRTVETILVTGMVAYLAMLVVPEPITKAAAAALTIVLVSYLGIRTVWRLISEYRELCKATAEATELSTVVDAGKRFGSAIGDSSARVFVMLVTVAIGQTAGLIGKAAGFLNKVPTLPGYGMAVAATPSRAGIPLAVAGNVESVLIADGAISVALAPAAVIAVARSAATSSLRFNFGFHSYSSFRYWHGPAGPGKEWHHIVEQIEANVKAFGAERLHNRSNVVALDKALHDKISQLYSSIAQRYTQSPSLTVRQWLGNKTFEEQRQFGEMILKRVLAGQPL